MLIFLNIIEKFTFWQAKSVILGSFKMVRKYIQNLLTISNISVRREKIVLYMNLLLAFLIYLKLMQQRIHGILAECTHNIFKQLKLCNSAALWKNIYDLFKFNSKSPNSYIINSYNCEIFLFLHGFTYWETISEKIQIIPNFPKIFITNNSLWLTCHPKCLTALLTEPPSL